MRCVMFDSNLPSGTGEKEENVEGLLTDERTDRQIDRRIDGRQVSEKLR